MKRLKMLVCGLLVLAIAFSTTGCGTMMGAAAGALIGAAVGDPATGALIGAAAGLILLDAPAIASMPPGVVWGPHTGVYGKPMCRDRWGQLWVWNGHFWERCP